jgi:hypothetical protein
VTIDDLKRRIDQLVAQAESTLGKARVSRTGSTTPAMLPEEWAALRSGSLAFIESFFGQDHTYYREFNKGLEQSYDYNGKYALGILRAIQTEIHGGWIETTKGLVTGEVFADFIEMAEHLLEEKYKDPAAVVVGSVLEEHLRQLCLTTKIDVEESLHGKMVARKADTLNSDLAKAGKYSKLDQKQVTAWLDLRNKAAHGKYPEYKHEQVAIMLAGVRDFLSRVRP